MSLRYVHIFKLKVSGVARISTFDYLFFRFGLIANIQAVENP